MKYVATAVVFATLAAATGLAGVRTNTPNAQQRIVLGQAIGKVALGMSLPQVRKVLGVPESVIEKRQLANGKTWVEYSWNLTEWRVAFAGGRVVRIGSSVRTERTKEGIGVGTRGSRVERTYRARCRPTFNASGFFEANWCLVASRSGARTAFVLGLRCSKGIPKGGECIEGEWLPPEVFSIYIFAAGEQLPVRLSP